MKKSLFASLSLLAVLTISACNFPNNKSNNKSDSNPSVSSTKPVEPSSNPNIPEEALNDALTYSQDRMRDADFSFNFSLEGAPSRETLKKQNRLVNRNLNPKGTYTYNPDGTINFDYDFDLNRDFTHVPFDYFSYYEKRLEELRQEALDIVDFDINVLPELGVIYHITNGARECYSSLSYDIERNFITVYKMEYFSAPVEALNDPSFTYPTEKITKIELYYNSENLETIHMVQILKGTSFVYDNMVEIYYIPNHYYSFLQSDSVEDPIYETIVQINYNVALKIDEKWQGMGFCCNTRDPFLKRSGTYEWPLGVSFIAEENGDIVTFNDEIYPVRDGQEVTRYTEIRESDKAESRLSRIDSGFGYASFHEGYFNIPMQSISTIKSYHVHLETSAELDYCLDEYYVEGTPLTYHPMFDNDDDYIELVDGSVLKKGYGYSTKAGKYYFNFSEGLFYNFDNQVIDDSLISDYPHVEFADAESYICPAEDFHIGYGLTLRLDTKSSNEDNLYTIKEFFNAYGLEISEQLATTSFDYSIEYCRFGHIYRGQLFEKLFGVEYNADSVIDILRNSLNAQGTYKKQLYEEYNALKKDNEWVCPNEKDVYGVETSHLPELSLVGGEATVGEDGVDVSSLQIKTPKSLVLHQGETYELKIGFGNEIIDDSYFPTFVYNQKEETIKAKDDVSKIALPIVTNNYQLNVRLLRIVGQNSFPVTKTLKLNVKQFNDFVVATNQDDKLGGYYKREYKYNNGLINVIINFIDTKAPEIIPHFEINNGVMNVTQFMTEKDLLETLIVKDNYDKYLNQEDVILIKDNVETPYINVGNDLLVNGKDYKVAVFDKAGNKGELSFKVNVNNVKPQASYPIILVQPSGYNLTYYDVVKVLANILYEEMFLRINIDDVRSVNLYTASNRSINWYFEVLASETIYAKINGVFEEKIALNIILID